MKIVINRAEGVFVLSRKALDFIRKAKKLKRISVRDLARDDPHLIEAIELFGNVEKTEFCDLHIVEIPDGVQWQLEDHDCQEWISEKHRTWR